MGVFTDANFCGICGQPIAPGDRVVVGRVTRGQLDALEDVAYDFYDEEVALSHESCWTLSRVRETD